MNAPVNLPERNGTAASSAAPVKIFIKAIAAGARKTGNKTFLKFVLQLLPKPVEQEQGGFSLSEWPKRVRQFLGKDKSIPIVLTSAKEKSEFPPMNLSLPLVNKAYPSLDGLTFPVVENELSALWQKTFGTCDVKELKDYYGNKICSASEWSLLHHSLEASYSGTALKMGDGEVETSTVSVKNVVSNNQAEQAIRLEILRAHELLLSIKGDALASETAVVTQQAKEVKPNERETTSSIEPSRQHQRKQALEALREARQAELDRLKEVLFKNPESNPKHPADLSYAELCADLEHPLASHAYATWYNRKLEQEDRIHAPAPDTTIAIQQDDLKADPRYDLLAQRFFNIQSSPALGRLYLIFCDAEVELDATLPDGIHEIRFASQALAVPGVDDLSYNVATLAKLDRTSLGEVQFWPALRACVDGSNDIDQDNGIVKLGLDQRFDLTSLDVRSAAEHAYERRKKRSQADREDISHVARRTVQRENHMTAGLSILDGGRKDAIKCRLTERHKQNSDQSSIVLDADDLLQGYRLDVGLALKQSVRWRSLMNRKIDYDAENLKKFGKGRLKDRFKILLSVDPNMIDSAVLSPHLQIAPKPTAEAILDDEDLGSNTADALVSDLIATWEGGPFAVDCTGSTIDKTQYEDLPFGRVIDLPGQKDESLLPNRLRFGYAYCSAMRAVYQGGLSIDLATAEKFYKQSQAGFTIPAPADKVHPARRFLRHERIAPPHLLLPANLAFQQPIPIMGLENARHAILRTITDVAYKDRAQPSSTARYIMPPNVPQAFAALHGVFDKEDGILRNGAGGVATNLVLGGFPAAEAVTKKGLNGEAYLKERRPVREPTGTSEPFFSTSDVQWPSPSKPEKVANEKYFADPLAEIYVIAVRHTSTGQYLPGNPLQVDARDGTTTYDNVLPLRLDITTGPRRDKGQKLQNSDVVSLAAPVLQAVVEALPEYAARAGKSKITKSRSVKVMRVNVFLAPGEDFEIDVWCLPKAADSSSKMADLAVVETLGAVALKRGNGKLNDGFKTLLPDTMELPFPLFAEDGTKCSGPRGMTTPSRADLETLGLWVHQHAALRPLPELTSVQTLRVTHAVNAPLVAPAFASEVTDKFEALAVCRPSAEALNRLATSPADCRYPFYLAKRKGHAESHLSLLVEHDAHDFVLGGDVLLDLDTSDSFDIIATSAAVRSTKIDDKNRGRSALDRRQGQWPKEIDSRNWGLQEDKVYVPTASVFGFHVAEDGTVSLPRTDTTLLQVRNLKSARETNQASVHGELEVVSLQNLYGIVGEQPRYQALITESFKNTREDKQDSLPPLVPEGLRGVRLSIDHAFPDGKARLLTLVVRSYSRFAGMMTTATSEISDGSVQVAEPLPDQLAYLDSKPKDVWLPATSAPSAPSTRSPVPIFRWEMEPEKESETVGLKILTLTRTAQVRVPLLREWFSSGEGERLGIVLWPPTLANAGTDLEKDQIVLQSDPRLPGKEPDRAYDAHEFVDEDLGPGGSFVTRWGGDPIRGGGTQSGNFIPLNQFRDYKVNAREDEPELVRSVLMPLGKPQSTAVKRSLDASGLIVSLLTYVPRFDVDREEWYVDVDLAAASAPDPFVRLGLVRYQKHAPFELQVSEPVVEWTQLLAERKMQVTYGQEGRTIIVEATVEGLASDGIFVAKSKDEQSSEDKSNQYPTMIFKAYFMSRKLPGMPDLLRQVELRVSETNLEMSSQQVVGGRRRWSTPQFRIPLPDDENFSDSRFFVTVEEVDRHQRATFDSEPIPVIIKGTAIEKEEFVDSGPRFSARLEIIVDWKSVNHN